MKYQNIKNKFYDVYKIITRNIKRGKKLYLIKWKGFSLKYCTWEPISHLTNIKSQVKLFDNNFPNSIDKKEYKEFLSLYKNYKKEKLMKKKLLAKNNENKNNATNKIVIDLDGVYDVLNDDLNSEEEYKTEEIRNIDENIIERNDEKEKQNNNNININNDLRNNCNFYGGEKLIKPILIW